MQCMRRAAWVIAFLLTLCAPASARQSAIAPDGTVYVVGEFAVLPFAPAPFSPPNRVQGLLRTSVDGTRVRGFGRDGFVPVSGGEHVTALAGGGAAVVGSDIRRYTADGVLVSATPMPIPFASLDDVRTLSDGRLLLSGLEHADDGRYRLKLAVLQADDALDPNFGEGGRPAAPARWPTRRRTGRRSRSCTV